MKLTFTNTYEGKPSSYDPEKEGFWAVKIKEGERLLLDETTGRHLSLGFGSMNSPQYSLGAAMADLALLLARYPVATGKVAIYKVPGVFSTNDGHVFITEEVPPEMLIEAIKASTFHVSRDNFRRKYGGSTIYC